jgi:TolA-binding protein
MRNSRITRCGINMFKRKFRILTRDLKTSLLFTLFVSLALTLMWTNISVAGAQEEAADGIIKLKEKSSQDALDVYSDAAKFQNGAKFEIAVEEWEAFQKEFQDDPLAPKAIYYLGICALQLQQYDKAATAFEFTAIRYAQHDSTESALFYWGRTRYVQASSLPNLKQKQAQLKTAIRAFGKQLAAYAKGSLADQALYLMGESHYGLGDKPAAIKSYQTVVTGFPKSKQRTTAVYALGATLEEEEKYAEAGKAYDIFLAEFPEDPLRTEIRMRKAETILQAKNYKEAGEVFGEVAAVEGYALADHSRMRQAFCLLQLKQYEAATAIFSAVLSAEETADFHTEAAGHLLSICREHIKEKKYDTALELADAFIVNVTDAELTVQIKLVAADALDGQQKYDDARKRYLLVVEQHSKHALAANALYFAAFAALKLKQHDNVIADAQAFLVKYPKHEFQPDVAKLLEESRILKSADLFQDKKHTEVVEILSASIKDNPQGSRVVDSLLLLARSSAALKEIDAAKGYAAQLIKDFPESKLVAEAQFRLGEYHYDAKEYELAIKQYASVVKDHSDSVFVANSLYSQAWSEVLTGKPDVAETTFTTLIEKHADHQLVSVALLGRGKVRRQQKKFKEAIADVDGFLLSKLDVAQQVDAWFEKGMSQIGLQQNAAAIETFNLLLTADAKYAGADAILYEIAFAQRTLDKHDAAKATFAKLVADHADSALAADAHFRLAEYQYADGQFKAALVDYTKAADSSQGSDALKENILHKQAWTHYKLDDFSASAAGFKDQVSKYAAGSFLHVGQFMFAESLYKLGDFQAAAAAFGAITSVTFKSPQHHLLVRLHGGKAASELKQYEQSRDLLQQVVDSEEEDAAEHRREAHFEIGWTYDREQNYEKALVAFAAAGRDRGHIGARAHFMIGDIAFKQKEFSAAIKQFDRTILRFEDANAPAKVKKYQALAAFEAGRCKEVLAGVAKDDNKLAEMKKLVGEAIAYYQMIIDKYPATELVKNATERIAELKEIE